MINKTFFGWKEFQVNGVKGLPDLKKNHCIRSLCG